MIVSVCVFLAMFYIGLGSLGTHAASWVSGGVCLCVPLTVTSRVDLSYQCTLAQVFTFVFL